MLGNRSFEFPISTLLRDSKRAHAILVARNRFLLDEFPSRSGASAGDNPATTTPASMPPRNSNINPAFRAAPR